MRGQSSPCFFFFFLNLKKESLRLTFTAPFGIWFDRDIAARIVIRIIYIELERSLFMRFDQCEEIFAFVQNGVGTNDVIAERTQTGLFRRRRWMHFQNVPDILIGTLK